MIIKYKRVTFIVFVELLHFESNGKYESLKDAQFIMLKYMFLFL